jgi:hypothetical protein
LIENRRLPSAPNAGFLWQMSRPYEEILEGATMPRSAPDVRHEMICNRLHSLMTASVANLSTTQLLAPRTKIPVTRSTVATGKIFLAVEVVNRGDHQPDTVIKKEVYEKIRVPRLWMVDPRYDNVEIYHSMEFGLTLKTILAGSEILSEKLVPEFQIVIAELFAAG